MKQTTTKLGVLAFLGLGVMAFGQTENYDGKVGINTEEPKATLEVKPNTDNLAGTTNEGIMAPQLSKTRVAAIKNPIEGTLVYITDNHDSSISAYTGNDDKVSDITEKGYYFYNGTKWVKTAGGSSATSLEPSIWTNDTANTLVKIKKLSNGTTDRSDLQNLSIKDDGKVLLGRGMNLQNDAVLSSSKLQVEGALSSLGVNNVGGGSIGPSLNFYNTSKTEDNQAYKWTIYNMTGLDSDPNRENKPSGYKNGLVFWAYNKNSTSNETNRPQMMLTDNGNLIIGGSIYRSTGKDFEEKLYVDGDAKITGLRGQGNRPVYADDNGKLIIGNAAATYNSSASVIVNNNILERAALTGDVTAIQNSNETKVTAIQGQPISDTAPKVGETLTWDGSKWVATATTASVGTTLNAITGKIRIVNHITVAEWKADDFALVQTGNEQIELPDPANYIGKIISVNNQYPGEGNTPPGQPKKLGLAYSGTNQPKNISTLAPGKGHIFMAGIDTTDGNKPTWFLIGGSY